jgi:plastocyanin
VTVPIFDNQFGTGDPTIRVRAGSVVAWIWRGRESHQVTAFADGFGSGTQTYGTYRARLTRPGVYRFVCSLHAPGMRMRVVVR